MIGRGKKAVWLSMAVGCLATVVLYAFSNSNVYAVQITARTLTLQARGSVGGSTPDGAVNHQFTFTMPTTGTLGSIKFLYCTTATITDTCTPPTGLTTVSATLGTSTGAVFTSAVSTAANSAYITRTAASGGGAVTEQLLNVHNPTAANTTFYVRISTYASTDASGTAIDTGSVAASTANQIVLSGYMPESLIFCAGAAVTKTSGVPDCSTASAGNINFNQSFSPTDTATAQSQMAASTNANSGYSITVHGPTLTSGSNVVTAMGNSPTTPVRGTSQFGLNLAINTTGVSNPAIPVGVTDPVDPVADAGTHKGVAATNYATPDQFLFNLTGDEVANSGSHPTDAQIYTVSYIVNVNGAQPVGTYVATLSYICTANF